VFGSLASFDASAHGTWAYWRTVEHPVSTSKLTPDRRPTWSARSLKRQGAVFAILGVVTAIVVAFLSVYHVILISTRNFELQVSIEFALIGLVTFLIGWKKGHGITH